MWSHPIYRNLLFCEDEVIYWYDWSSEFFTNDFEASLDIKFFYSGLERKKVDLGKNNNMCPFFISFFLSLSTLFLKNTAYHFVTSLARLTFLIFNLIVTICWRKM